MPVKTREEIITTLKSLMKTNAGEYHLKRLGIFGSYARGDQDEDSDVDLLVEFSDPPDLFTFYKLEEFLEKEIGVKVEAVRKEALRPEFKDKILSETIFL
jgi:uncharacterized protein